MLTTSVSRRSIHLLDALLAVWAAAWIGLAVLVFTQLRGLTELSEALAATGRAAESTGRALAPLERIPVLGAPVGELAEEIRETGVAAGETAESTERRILWLSFFVSSAIALAPILPPLALYLPVRLSWTRDRRKIRHALRDVGNSPWLQEHLARRAVEHLRYGQLTKFSSSPWNDLERGRYRELAQAELERLGLLDEAVE